MGEAERTPTHAKSLSVVQPRGGAYGIWTENKPVCHTSPARQPANMRVFCGLTLRARPAHRPSREVIMISDDADSGVGPGQRVNAGDGPAHGRSRNKSDDRLRR